MIRQSTRELETVSAQQRSFSELVMESHGGLLRLCPTWVPRSFLHPGGRLKLHPDDLYAFGASRGGIDERWFGSTTEAANEGRRDDEGLSYVVHKRWRIPLRDIVNELGAPVVGEQIWNDYGRWPVYSKFFDNMGPIPHHMHQNDAQAALVGQEGKPESYYFPPQHNTIRNNFPYTFMGLVPGTKKEQVRQCLERWEKGDNGILAYSQAYMLEPGTGWFMPPGVLHAPGSLCTYEPQWGSDVFGMYQSLVEGRAVPRSLLVKDVPSEKHDDLEYLVDQLDWDQNVDSQFKEHHFREPRVHTEDEEHVDKWIVYGRMKEGRQPFTAKELTVRPMASVSIEDPGASSLIVVQGSGRLNEMRLRSPSSIRFDDLTEDELFITASAAKNGLHFVNDSETEPLVVLRYFGPEVQPDAPEARISRQPDYE